MTSQLYGDSPYYATTMKDVGLGKYKMSITGVAQRSGW